MGSVDLQDYMDMNGDGYPDIVYKDAVQLTNSTGGLTAIQGPYTNAWLTNTNSYQNSVSAQFSISSFKSVGAAFRNGFSETLRAQHDNSSPWSSSLSGNYDSKDVSESYWLDINGDGLVDRITGGGSSMKYYLNLGYKVNGTGETFANSDTFSSRPVGAAGLSFGTSLGSISNLPISVGVSASASLGTSDTTLEDINGDGLLDVLMIGSSSTQVRYNLGNKFSAPITLYKKFQGGVDFNNESKTYNGGISVGGHYYHNTPIIYIIIPFIWIPIPIVYLKIGGQASASVGVSISETDKAFKDMNGDGFSDLVISRNDGFTVNYSTIGRTNKLRQVTSIYNRMPLNQFTIDYEFTKPNYNDPHARLVMKEVKVINTDINSGNYLESNPSYDAVTRFRYETLSMIEEREIILDLKKLSQKKLDGANVYRSNVETFYNKGYFLNGLLKKSESSQAHLFYYL